MHNVQLSLKKILLYKLLFVVWFFLLFLTIPPPPFSDKSIDDIVTHLEFFQHKRIKNVYDWKKQFCYDYGDQGSLYITPCNPLSLFDLVQCVAKQRETLRSLEV